MDCLHYWRTFATPWEGTVTSIPFIVKSSYYISCIDMTYSNNIEIWLLRVFCAVYETRSTSRAAKELMRTQPAVSYALAQLRSALSDQLFIRSREGMMPSALADRLYPGFRQGLDVIKGALSSVEQFDSKISDRRFRMAMTDIGEMVFLPPLISYLRKHAPSLSIETCQLSPTETSRALATGQLDFAIGYMPEMLPRLSSINVFTERYVCVFSRSVKKRRSLTAATFLKARHVIVSSVFNSHNAVTEALAAQGAHRSTALKVSHFTSLPAILAQTDLMGIVPSRVAKLWATTHRLQSAPLPLAIPDIKVTVRWDPRFDLDPGHVWMRELIVTTLSEL